MTQADAYTRQSFDPNRAGIPDTFTNEDPVAVYSGPGDLGLGSLRKN